MGILNKTISMAVFLAFFCIFLLGRPHGATALEVQRVVSPGGIEAWLIEDHTNPIIAMRFAFRGGANLDPAGKQGLANLVSGLLDEGAGPLDSQAFQQRLEDLAITLRFDAGRDTFGGRLRTLTVNRDTAFDLLTKSLTVPRFDAEPVERLRSQILATLRREAEDPDMIARRKLFATLFPDHPYGRPVSGSKEAVAAISADDLRGFVARRLAREGLAIGVVGDISPTRLATSLDNVFGALPAKGTDWRVAEAKPARTGTTEVIRKPTPQSAIVFGQRGVKRDNADYYAAYVLNHILGGGGFTSRLYNEVREKRGLAYSVYAALYPMDFAGLIFGGSGTRNEAAAKTVEIVRAQWKRMADSGPTAEELTDARQFLTGSFALRFSSSARIAAVLVAMQLDDLGIDYLDRRNAFIDAVTLDDVRRVARDLLDPNGLTFVVVGQPNGL
ncbi:MAG: insulinase family protein [Rhodospirillales bacterium]|nr:insulinase family protein [Rhodospirillales bacterium]